MHPKLISADSHVNPPPDLWQRDAPAKLKDRVPRVESTPDGDMWVTDGKSTVIPGCPFMAGREHRDYKIRIHYKEMRPGSWDPQARLADMDQDGIFVDVLYGGGPARFDDPELRAFCIQRYNDWLFELERCERPPPPAGPDPSHQRRDRRSARRARAGREEGRARRPGRRLPGQPGRAALQRRGVGALLERPRGDRHPALLPHPGPARHAAPASLRADARRARSVHLALLRWESASSSPS
jgi:hypothetical protein